MPFQSSSTPGRRFSIQLGATARALAAGAPQDRHGTFGEPARAWKSRDRKPVPLPNQVDFETAS